MIKNLAIAILVLVVVLMSGALFVVKEGERAIVIQFGKVQRDDATGETTRRRWGRFLFL